MAPPLRVIVADDEADIRDWFLRTLPRLGHQVVAAAANGTELVEQCRRLQPDLVISDIKMPDTDGIAAAAQVCGERPVPVILVSAYHDTKLIERAQLEDIQAYLIKPVRQADLEPAIALARRRFEQIQALRDASLTDELTGLNNRRGFLTLAEQEAKRARRDQKQLWLVFADIDGLKQINDVFGHEEGDRALKAAADVIRETFRGSDIKARFGGDEFCVLAVDDSSTCAVVVDRLRQNVERHNARTMNNPFRLSLSIGAARVDPARTLFLDEPLRQADRLLYGEKHAKHKVG
jgi:diguanylate cyclase (GGDEF)-like protein